MSAGNKREGNKANPGLPSFGDEQECGLQIETMSIKGISHSWEEATIHSVCKVLKLGSGSNPMSLSSSQLFCYK